MKGRVYDAWVNSAGDNIEKACHDFIDNYITEPPVWGGIEAIKALSEILNVNIISINDDGSCNIPNHFDTGNERSLSLFFKACPTRKVTILIEFIMTV